MQKILISIRYIIILAFTSAVLFGCAESFCPAHEIHAVTREEGSGTRTAFCEPLGLSKNGIDMICSDIAVSNSTAVVLSSVAGNCHAIGYVSFTTINDAVKAVGIDGVYPSAETIADGSYPLVRPFILVYRRDNTAAQALADYILSDIGRDIVRQCGFAPPAVKTANLDAITDDLSVSGSSSVYPPMEQIREVVIRSSPDIRFDLLQSDSSSGIAAVRDGICDVGMMSRLPTSKELGSELDYSVIALDCIAVIVSQNNPTSNLTSQQLRRIYVGEVTVWDEL